MPDEKNGESARDQVLSLRRQGWDYRAIGDAVGIKPKEAKALVSSALRDAARETASESHKLEIARLDTLLTAVFPAAEGGDPKAVDAALKIMERRARLLGIEPLASRATKAGRPRVDERVGKKEQQQIAAEKISGKFAPPMPPKLVVNNE